MHQKAFTGFKPALRQQCGGTDRSNLGGGSLPDARTLCVDTNTGYVCITSRILYVRAMRIVCCETIAKLLRRVRAVPCQMPNLSKNTGENKILTLCEVQVLGTFLPEPSCIDNCSKRDASEILRELVCSDIPRSTQDLTHKIIAWEPPETPQRAEGGSLPWKWQLDAPPPTIQ